MLTYGFEANATHLESSIFLPDEASQHDTLTWNWHEAKAEVKGGADVAYSPAIQAGYDPPINNYQKRGQIIRQSKSVQWAMPVLHDFLQVSQIFVFLSKIKKLYIIVNSLADGSPVSPRAQPEDQVRA